MSYISAHDCLQGFPNPTDERHCVNSKSLKFQGA
jgi:peptide methionine sulfoxide reductase MsrB